MYGRAVPGVGLAGADGSTGRSAGTGRSRVVVSVIPSSGTGVRRVGPGCGTPGCRPAGGASGKRAEAGGGGGDAGVVRRPGKRGCVGSWRGGSEVPVAPGAGGDAVPAEDDPSDGFGSCESRKGRPARVPPPTGRAMTSPEVSGASLERETA